MCWCQHPRYGAPPSGATTMTQRPVGSSVVCTRGDVAGNELLRDRDLTVRAHRANEVNCASAEPGLGCHAADVFAPWPAKIRWSGRVVVVEDERCGQGCNVVDHDVPDNDKNCVDHEVSLPEFRSVSPMPEHRRYEPQARHWR